jgi:vitamin B12 transporter
MQTSCTCRSGKPSLQAEDRWGSFVCVPTIWNISFLATLALASPVKSAQQSPDAELEPVVVTATALPRPYESTPATVSVITREEIEQLQANRVSELLFQIPGLHVDQMGSRGGLSSVYIRGGDPNFTLVMIDGVQINDPTNPRGGSVDLSTLLPEHIDRIEIVRGPLSSLYGSDAMAGAINIITRRGKTDAIYDFVTEAGNFGYARAAASTAGAFQNIKYAASFGFNRNDEQVKKDKFNAGNIGLNLDLLDSNNASLRWTTYFTRTDARAFPEGSGGPRLAFIRDAEERETQEVVSGLRLSLDGTRAWKQEISADVFHRGQDVDSPGVQITKGVFQLPPARFETGYVRYQVQWKHTFQFAPKWALVGGAQVRYEEGQREGFQKLTSLGAPADLRSNFAKSRFTPAVVAEANAGPFSDFTITSAFRIDFPETGQSELSPKLGLLYRAGSGTDIRLNVGRGFKLPSFNALGDPLIGNRHLKPEKSIGADFGVEQRLFSDRLSFGVTYFFNRFSDLVDLDPDLAGSGIFKLTNLSTVETQGLEMALKLRVFDSITAKTYFNYLHSDIKGTDEPLRNRPTFSGGFSAVMRVFEPLLLRADINLIGRTHDLQIPTRNTVVDRYTTLNLSVTYALSQAWRLYTVVENLTNTKYEDYLGFRQPGTLVRFGLGIQK